MSHQISKEMKLFDDPLRQKRLDEIGKKIATSSDRQDLKYNFKIVKDKQFNAFANILAVVVLPTPRGPANI